MNRKDTGRLGETLVQEFLKKKKYRILDTNYRCPSGEIDIVAQRGDCLVFVEVRTKRNENFGSPEESITSSKKEHLENSVAHYLQTHGGMPINWRVDLAAVEIDYTGKLKRIEILENAFD